MARFTRVRYSGNGTRLGRYGNIATGDVFTMRAVDFDRLQDDKGEYEAVGACDKMLPKESVKKDVAVPVPGDVVVVSVTVDGVPVPGTVEETVEGGEPGVPEGNVPKAGGSVGEGE
jgi:hypothetical protein